jgi:hypothetical protein
MPEHGGLRVGRSLAIAKWEKGWFPPTGRDRVLGLPPHSNLGAGLG